MMLETKTINVLKDCDVMNYINSQDKPKITSKLDPNFGIHVVVEYDIMVIEFLVEVHNDWNDHSMSLKRIDDNTVLCVSTENFEITMKPGFYVLNTQDNIFVDEISIEWKSVNIFDEYIQSKIFNEECSLFKPLMKFLDSVLY